MLKLFSFLSLVICSTALLNSYFKKSFVTSSSSSLQLQHHRQLQLNQRKSDISDDLFNDEGKDSKKGKVKSKKNTEYLDEDWIVDDADLEEVKDDSLDKELMQTKKSTTKKAMIKAKSGDKVPQVPVFALLYLLTKEYCDDLPLDVIKEHEEYLLKFPRAITSETIKLPDSVDTCTCSVWAGFEEGEEEEKLTRAEITSFMAKCPLLAGKDYVEKWELVNLGILKDSVTLDNMPPSYSTFERFLKSRSLPPSQWPKY